MKSRHKNRYFLSIILLLLTLLILGIFLEAAARVFAHFSNRFLCDTFSEPDDWFLCRLELDLGKVIEKNRSAILLDKNICDKWDAELGWVPNPNCRSVRGLVKYSTNSHGFRNSMDFRLEKSKKRI